MRTMICAALTGAALLAAPSAQATTLLINNADFEADQYAEGGYTPGKATGWRDLGWYEGTANQTAAQFANHAAQGTTAYVSRIGFSASQSVKQTIADYVIAANTRYTLSVDVGNRADIAGFGGYGFGLMAGDTQLGNLFANLWGTTNPLTGATIGEGTFQRLTLVFETGAAGAEIGELLTVVFGGGPNSGYGADYDNFHLDATPIGVSAVPEPATWAMMIIGFGAVGTMVRGSRRRTLSLA